LLKISETQITQLGKTILVAVSLLDNLVAGREGGVKNGQGLLDASLHPGTRPS
jgi:hypothetical protein